VTFYVSILYVLVRLIEGQSFAFDQITFLPNCLLVIR